MRLSDMTRGTLPIEFATNYASLASRSSLWCSLKVGDPSEGVFRRSDPQARLLYAP